MSTKKCHINTVTEAEVLLPEQTQEQLRYATLFAQASLRFVLYAPQEVDNQTPHEQDEVYVIVSGEGKFTCGMETRSFAPGDIIFVAANTPHRFLEFTDDFKTWAIFYGPPGGEADNE